MEDQGEAQRDPVLGIWAAYWRAQADMPPWDFMCETIWHALHRALAPHGVEARSVLEAGCGSGRVSHRLAAEGWETDLIDINPEAIRLSRSLQGGRSSGRFVCGSCCQMPYATGVFGLAFNEGVLEHLAEDQQRVFLAEMVRVVRPGGFVVTMNPYARSWLYLLGKAALEAAGRWPYGPERPIRSLRGMAGGVEECGEWSFGFLVILAESLSRLLIVRGGRRAVHRLAVWAYRFRLVRAFDRLLAWLFGGYLLVTTIRKPGIGLAAGLQGREP